MHPNQNQNLKLKAKVALSLCFSLQLVSPGAWLCDLTLERYEVREKKISKKVLFVLQLPNWRSIYIKN